MNFFKIKITAVLCAVLFAVLAPLLYACEGGANDTVIEDTWGFTAKEVADAIMAVYGEGEIPDEGMEHFYSGADENSDNYLDAAFAGLLINGAYDDLEEYGLLADCALYIPIGKHIFEIDVLKAAKGDKKSIDGLKGVLERRFERVKSSDVLVYAPEDAPLLENAKVMTAGVYVIFLATTDNGKAENIINEMIK
jgi:hypothetical protein